MHAKEDRLDVHRLKMHKDTQTAWYSNKTDLLSTISFLRNICEVLQERAACAHFIGVLASIFKDCGIQGGVFYCIKIVGLQVYQ